MVEVRCEMADASGRKGSWSEIEEAGRVAVWRFDLGEVVVVKARPKSQPSSLDTLSILVAGAGPRCQVLNCGNVK